MPAGGSVTYTASCAIHAAATGVLSNTATVSSGITTDPNPGNNSATDTDIIASSADLAISNTDSVTTVTAGGSTTYTIIASNAGPSNASGAAVSLPFPAALTCTWTCVGSGGGTCTASGSGNIADTVNLPAAGSVTYTASCAISPSTSGNLSTTATVSGSTADPNTGNNNATDTNFITALSYSITAAASPVAGGSVVCSPNPVSSGGSASCTQTVNPFFRFTGWSGACSGTGACNLSNITSNQSVTANYVPAPLGNASLQGTPFTGTTVPPPVANGGLAAGIGSASFTSSNGGPNCGFDAANTGFIAPVVIAGSPNLIEPQGLFRFKLSNCTAGFTARITITWPQNLGVVSYYKYGRAAASTLPADGLYQPQNLSISGNSASFDVTDGGWGDNDLSLNGEITDPSGPFVAAAPVSAEAVPGLSHWAWLSGLMGLMLLGLQLQRRGLQRRGL
jgi:uncharacterized repeat protein (TIGR01451 family)